MREEHIPNMVIHAPHGSAFGCETAPNLPKLHQACLIVGPRGSGKTTACVNLVEKLPFDRIFVISPSIKSNKELMSRLKIDPLDVYEDPDDATCLDKIKQSIEGECDDLETYLQLIKQYRKLSKRAHMDAPLFQFEDVELSQMYHGGAFQPPKHKWNGRRPCCCLIIDDAQGSQLYSKPRKFNQFTIYHGDGGDGGRGGRGGGGSDHVSTIDPVEHRDAPCSRCWGSLRVMGVGCSGAKLGRAGRGEARTFRSRGAGSCLHERSTLRVLVGNMPTRSATCDIAHVRTRTTTTKANQQRAHCPTRRTLAR